MGVQRGKDWRLEARIAQWRTEHGGRGVRWPAELWAAVVAAARTEGVGSVARRLGIAPGRLAARLDRARGNGEKVAATEFVELDPRRLSPRSVPGAVLRFDAGDGRKLELEIHDGNAVDLLALVQEFWGRGG